MHLTRETLLKLAQDTVTDRVRKDRHLLAAYLCGSLLDDDHLLGGTTDIDLFFVHLDSPAVGREIVRLTDDIHLDLAHLDQKEYRQARQLRVHPWRGPSLNNSRVLYDPQHFMDFTVASVRGQFNRTDHIYERASQPAANARRIWFSLQENPSQPGPEILLQYLRAVSHAANAIAALSGPPLTERRFLLGFPARAAAVGKPGLYPGLLGLLGASRLEPGQLAAWIGLWQAALEAISPAQGASLNHIPARLNACRRTYYLRAFEALLDSPQPENALWPLLHTWCMAAALLPEDSPTYQDWQAAFTHLDLAGAGFAERLSALDAYLDLVEEILEGWARQNGV